ncbi:hypothetical protein [Desulfobacter sp.]|uniref:hypothetical protein n=1 Tax=Desulfobacter sp. TaxID=2294 RepID=UPI003D1502BA
MDRFVNSILSQAPGCPRSVIKQHVLKAAIRFCSETWVWQLKEDCLVLKGAVDVILSAPEDAAITGILEFKLNGRDFQLYSRSGAVVSFDAPIFEDGIINITKAFIPMRDASALPDILHDEWFEGVEAGALFSLRSMPEKPWTDSGGVRTALSVFYSEIGKAKIRARLKNDVAGTRVKSVRFI